MISTHALCRSFGDVPALVDVSLDAAPGEILALLGPNGAGKTTTVRLLNGILVPDSGHSRVLGLDPATDGVALRRRTGVLTENAGLDDRLTAVENLMTTIAIRGLDHGPERAVEALEALGIGDRAHDRVAGFSTGQRKRVALARSLLHDPEVLFLDEPTSGLDPQATREVVGLIAELATEHGRTVVLCTHFLGEAGRLADRVAILDRGQVLAFGTPRGLADELVPTLRVEVALAGGPDDATVDGLTTVAGVTGVERSDDGVMVETRDAAVTPDLVAHLVAAGRRVESVVPHRPTLEDVYFEVLHRAGRDPDPVAPADRVGDNAMWTGV